MHTKMNRDPESLPWFYIPVSAIGFAAVIWMIAGWLQ